MGGAKPPRVLDAHDVSELAQKREADLCQLTREVTQAVQVLAEMREKYQQGFWHKALKPLTLLLACLASFALIVFTLAPGRVNISYGDLHLIKVSCGQEASR